MCLAAATVAGAGVEELVEAKNKVVCFAMRVKREGDPIIVRVIPAGAAVAARERKGEC